MKLKFFKLKIVQQRILIAFTSVILIVGLTVISVQFAQGYRFNFKHKQVELTGLLVVKSKPPAAQLFLDDKLTAATDANLSLPKGTYTIKITKPGYQIWQKELPVDKGLVTQVEARLWPISPDLSKITYAGAIKPVLSPLRNEIAFVLPDSEAVVDWQLDPGLYILDLSTQGFLNKKEVRLIAKNTQKVKFHEVVSLDWSPDGTKIMAKFDKQVFLLSTKNLQDNTPLLDISYQEKSIQRIWQKQKSQQLSFILDKIKPPLNKQITDLTKVIAISPDESKILYQATQSGTLTRVIDPPLPGNSHLPEVRQLKVDDYYVYDIKDDKNYFLISGSDINEDDVLWWMSDSSHILLARPNRLFILEDDGGNKTLVFAGEFDSRYVFPHLSNQDIIVLTSLNPAKPDFYNLYNLSLR